MPQQKEKTHYVHTVLYDEPVDSKAKRPERIVMLSSEKVITIIFSYKLIGTTKTGLTWSKWIDSHKLIFSCRPRGGSNTKQFNVYYWTKVYPARARFGNVSTGKFLPKSFKELSYLRADEMMGNPDKETSFNTAETEAMTHVFNMYENNFGKIANGEAIPRILKTTPILCYPLIQDGQFAGAMKNGFQMSPVLATAFRKDTFQEATQLLFGKRKYRKDLVKAVAKTDPRAIIFFLNFKNAIPIDWIITQLNKAELDPNSSYGYIPLWDSYHNSFIKNTVQFFTTLPVNTQKNLLNDIKAPYEYNQIMLDTTRMHSQLMNSTDENKEKFITKDLFKAKTWHELHEKLSSTQQLIRTQNKEIPLTEDAKKLEKVFAYNEKYQIVPAKDTHELAYWGKVMSNCIGSYANSAVAGITTVAKLMENNEMIANIEVRDGICYQIYAQRNSQLPDEQEIEIVNAMLKSEAITESRMRGWY
jgi:hypothetical protein